MRSPGKLVTQRELLKQVWGPQSSPASWLKRLLLGRPFRSDRLGETLLPKRLALPIFASDPLSSVAYATQEILLVLTLGGLPSRVHALVLVSTVHGSGALDGSAG